MRTAMLSALPIQPGPGMRPLHQASAAVGAVAWVAAWTMQPHLETALFLLAPLVVVPLGLAAIASSDRGAAVWLSRAAAWLQLPAALVLVAAFTLAPGRSAALLTLPWVIVTLLIAGCGLVRLRRRGLRPLEELAISTGRVYLAIAGGWVLLSRWGVQPLGFSALIVLLTAVHFHYAGFVLPLLSGLGGRQCRDLVTRVALLGGIIGVPLVAAGINLTQLGFRDLEPWAATWLASAGLLTALLQLRLALRRGTLLPRLLIAISGLSLFAGMMLAIVYAWGRYSGLPWLDIPEMLPYHGAVNAVGFGLAGLLAWNLSEPARL